MRVTGDSVYEGLPVVTLATAMTVTSETSGGSLGINSKGEGTGRAYYSRSLGLIVYQVGVSQVESNTQIGDMTMQGRNRGETTFKLVRKAR